MNNTTQQLVTTLEQQLIERSPDMNTEEILHAYSISTNARLTPSGEDQCKKVSLTNDDEHGVLGFDELEKVQLLNTTKSKVVTEVNTEGKDESDSKEEETPEPEPKPAKKKVAKKTTKKKAKKEEEEEPTEEKSEPDEDLPDLDDVYEEIREAYDESRKRGVESDQFIDLVTEAGYSSIDNIKDVKVMIKLRDATLKLKKLKV